MESVSVAMEWQTNANHTIFTIQETTKGIEASTHKKIRSGSIIYWEENAGIISKSTQNKHISETIQSNFGISSGKIQI